MYEAFMIYASIANETISEGGDLRDGMAVTQKFWNREFRGIFILLLYLIETHTLKYWWFMTEMGKAQEKKTYMRPRNKTNEILQLRESYSLIYNQTIYEQQI